MVTRFLLTFAVEMQGIVLGWQMYILTKNALYLGLIGLTEAVPAIGLALYAGHVVDRNRPLTIYRRVTQVCFLSAVVMLFSQVKYGSFGRDFEVMALFFSSFLTGVARAYSQPTIFALVPRIVTREDLPRAAAWMSTSMQAARVTGPALGGFLFGWIGLTGTALTVCALIFASTIVSFLVRHPPLVELAKVRETIRKSLLSGAAFVLRHPILFPALSLDMVSVLFGGVTALLPIYAAEVLFIGPKGLGLLRAAPAIGAVFMGLVVSVIDIRKRAGPYLLSSVAGFGVCIIVFALSRNYLLSLAALVLSGAFDSVSMIVRSTAVQLASPDSMRGRISSVNSIFIGSSNEIGEFESGVAARFMGTVPAAVFGGIVCLATVAFVSLKSRTLRTLDLTELKNS